MIRRRLILQSLTFAACTGLLTDTCSRSYALDTSTDCDPSSDPEEKSSAPRTWTPADDAVLKGMVEAEQERILAPVLAEMRADVLRQQAERQRAVAAEWAALRKAFGDPATATPAGITAVEQKVTEWKADTVRSPSRTVTFTGSVSWNGKTQSMDGTRQVVPGLSEPVNHAATIQQAEVWLLQSRTGAHEAAGSGTVEGADWSSPTLGKMKWINSGSFAMGSLSNELGRAEEETRHWVTVTRGFLLMEHEVTQEEWQMVMGSNPAGSEYKGVSLLGNELPVQNVSWEDIQSFIQKVSVNDMRLYRLPTEEEWEYAARAGTETMYSGTSEADSVCLYGNVADGPSKAKLGLMGSVFQCEDGYVGPAPVKSFHPNAWGLYDMTGNVLEWVQNWFWEYPEDEGDYVPGVSGDFRTVRGGSWYHSPVIARAAARGKRAPGDRHFALGFRLAADAE